MVKNKHEGKGVYTSADGDRYDGEWKNDKREGKGVYTFSDGHPVLQNYKNGNLIYYNIQY
jgi:hypothetical protein